MCHKSKEHTLGEKHREMTKKEIGEKEREIEKIAASFRESHVKVESNYQSLSGPDQSI
jgi:hypothetical protein